jgi:hypothetical protein
MKITNKHNVPETLMTLANRNSYSKGKADYSVTEIISSPRIKRLQSQHYHQMEQDVSEMLWALMGSALHVVAEGGQTKGHVTEGAVVCRCGWGHPIRSHRPAKAQRQRLRDHRLQVHFRLVADE